jgi:hypothetical protein
VAEGQQLVEAAALYRKAGELRSQIGRFSVSNLTRREAFDLVQLVEELALYLKQLAESQQEID